MLKNVILVFLYFASTALLWQFVIYPLLMSMVVYATNPNNKVSFYEPFVTVLVATYNEEKVIRKRIDNLFSLDYPSNKYEIIVIDSASVDRTRDIVRESIKHKDPKNASLRLLEEKKRNGKASAINIGVKNCSGDLILIADANSVFEKDVLRKMVVNFEDPTVGAVSGRYCVSNSNNHVSTSESFYWELEDLVFRGESIIDSISTVVGTISMWRKELMSFNENAVTEDLDMTIRVRRKGFKVKYESKAVVYEAAATTSDDQIKQRKRTSLGTIQCIRNHFSYFAVPKDVFSFMIFPSHKILPMLSPFLFLYILIGYVLLWDIRIVALHIVLNLVAFVFLLFTLLYLKSKLTIGKKEVKFSLRTVPKIIFYVLLNEYLILLAWFDYLIGKRSVLWEKATSTREI